MKLTIVGILFLIFVVACSPAKEIPEVEPTVSQPEVNEPSVPAPEPETAGQVDDSELTAEGVSEQDSAAIDEPTVQDIESDLDTADLDEIDADLDALVLE